MFALYLANQYKISVYVKFTEIFRIDASSLDVYPQWISTCVIPKPSTSFENEGQLQVDHRDWHLSRLSVSIQTSRTGEMYWRSLSCQHALWMLLPVLAAPLPTQLLANSLEKAEDSGQVFEPSFLYGTPGPSSWPQPGSALAFFLAFWV